MSSKPFSWELSNGWMLKDETPGTGQPQSNAEQFSGQGWLPVQVPGDVHHALQQAGRIEDPFYDRNEADCAWIESREWWYALPFDGPTQAPAPGERLRLVFYGLDTFVTLWLNGVELAQSANMFRALTVDVTAHLRYGAPNLLTLRFDPPPSGPPLLEGWALFDEHRVWQRKAQYGYGWDWGPRLPSLGIWRPIELYLDRQVQLLGTHFYTVELAPNHSWALVAVRIDLEELETLGGYTVQVRLAADGETVATADASAFLVRQGSSRSGVVHLRVDSPRLWWTSDLGEAYLYDLQVTVEREGTILAERNQRVGLRSLQLDQSPDPDERGTRFFRFILNGVPIFCKGANWIPADSFLGSMTPDRYRALVLAARDANMNMLRVWGGGVYEDDAFYSACDEQGILVWQDFMFACAAYPETPALQLEVDLEARQQIKRLRSHACLALWCGNNENQWIHEMEHWNRPDVRVPGALYYDHILPQAVRDLDGHTPYWPGSPFGGDDDNSHLEGDRHNWRVWHGNQERHFGQPLLLDDSAQGVAFGHYAEDMGRFISEFGMHAAPVLETLYRVTPADQMYRHSPSLDHRNKDNPKDKGDRLMQTVTGLPKDLLEYVDFSQIAQAEGLKFGIEHFRRRKPHCSGTLFWQFNDCWPALSWSVVDYYRFAKAGFYAVRRAYAPVLASFKERSDDAIELWVTNDTLSVVQDDIQLRLGDFEGRGLWQETRPVCVPANVSQCVWVLPDDLLERSPSNYLAVRSTGGQFSANRHFFAAIQHQVRPVAQVTLRIVCASEHELQVELTTDVFARYVQLVTAHERTWFSDNHLDLEPGEVRQITVKNSEVILSSDMLNLRWS